MANKIRTAPVTNLWIPMSRSVLDRDFPILCNTAGLDADGFGATVMPETYRTVLNVPAGIDLSARLTHEAEGANVGAGLTEHSGNVKRIWIPDEGGGDISADLTDLAG